MHTAAAVLSVAAYRRSRHRGFVAVAALLAGMAFYLPLSWLHPALAVPGWEGALVSIVTGAAVLLGLASWWQVYGVVRRDLSAFEQTLLAAKALSESLGQRSAESPRELSHVMETLWRAEDRLRVLELLATDGVLDWNFDTGEVYYSPRWKQMLGYEDEELPNVAETWKRLIVPEDLPGTERALKRHLDHGEPYQRILRFRHKHGSIIWVMARGVAFRDETGRAVRMVRVHTDITRLKQAETLLAESERRLELALSAAQAGAWSWNLRDNTVTWDARMEALTGVRLGPKGAPYEQAVRVVHPEDLAMVQAVSAAALGEQRPYDVVFRVADRYGGWRWLHARAGVTRDIDGKPLELDGLCLDVTEQMLVRQQLEQSILELQQFAYVASHDLQEPLRTIANFCQLIRDRYQDAPLDARGRQWLSLVIEGSTRMKALVNDLLAYSRLDSRGGRLEEVDTGKALDYALENLKGAIEESGAEISRNDLPVVNAYGSQLMQLFQNLIGNAIKYRGDNRPRIRICAERVGDCWKFCVEDNGIGIPQRYHEQIFGIFKRLHRASEYGGSGIGLALCRRIVTRHRGRIWVESEAGKGSQFYFTLAVNFEEDCIPEQRSFPHGQPRHEASGSSTTEVVH